MARDTRPSAEAMVGRPSGMLTLTPAASAAAGGAGCPYLCHSLFGSSLCSRGPERVLPRSFRRLAGLAKLVLRTLRFAPRLAELLLC